MKGRFHPVLIVTILLSLILLCSSPPTQAKVEAEATLADYLLRLRQAQETLKYPTEIQDRQTAQETISRAFPDQEIITFPDGQKRKLTLPIKTLWQDAEKLSAAKLILKEQAALSAVLSLYIRGLESAGQHKALTFQEQQKLKTQLDEILRSPEFSGYKETLWLQKLIEWLSEWLRNLLKPLGGKDVSFLKYFAYGLLALLIAFIFYFVFKTLRPLFARRAAGKPLKAEAAAEEDFRKEDWWTRAGDLAAEGNFRSAARACYLGLLQLLEQERRLRYNRSKTNWEYLAELVSWPALAAPMRELTLSFDLVWYGQQPPDPEGYRQFHQRCQEVRESLKGDK